MKSPTPSCAEERPRGPRQTWRAPVASTLLWAITCCGGPTQPDGGQPDGGPDGGDGGGFELHITPPAAPTLTPCPAGWRETPLTEDVDRCEPWPETGPQECPRGHAHFPGEPSCVAIGAPCPGGQWAEDLPSDGTTVIYVSAEAPPGGDGSRERPYATAAEALDRARSGDVVALGRGTYEEPVVLGAGETLWGACAAETTITTSWQSGAAGVVTVAGEGAVLRDVRVTGDRSGVWVSGPYSLEMDGVLVDGAERLGVLVRASAVASLRGVVVRGTRPVEGSGIEGRGLAVEGGGEVSLIRGVIADNHVAGVAVVGEGSLFEGEDLAIRQTLSAADSGGWGVGLYVDGGARVTCETTVVEHCRTAGVYAAGEGTELTLTRTLITDVASREADDDHGMGVQVEGGAAAELDRIVVQRATTAGIHCGGEGTTLAARDVVVVDTRESDLDGRAGYGLIATVGAVAEVERGLFAANHHAGITSSRDGTDLRLADVVVAGTRSAPWGSDRGFFGRGMEAIFGGQLSVERALVDGNREVGIVALGQGVEVALTDVQVLDTLTAECGDGACAGAGGGIAIGAYGGAHVEGARFEVSRAALVGIQLAEGSTEGGGGTMDLREGEVSHCPIGANVQTDGFDLERLMDRVIYRDNGRDLDSEALPVPAMEPPDGD